MAFAFPKHSLKATTATNSLSALQALVPLTVSEAQDLLSTTGPPTGAQYATYWGRTPRERYGRALESAIVSFLGVFFSYFLSFVVGGFVATILGCMFFFWGILSPEFQAYQRNWEFLGGRPLVDEVFSTRRGGDPDKAGLYPALFMGRIEDVCVVEDAQDVDEYDLEEFEDYTMATDELENFAGQPYLLRVRCSERTRAGEPGRALQIHTRMSEEYVGGVLRVGMPVTAVLLSTDRSFRRLAALTDLYVPEANLWIGDYPYLNREKMEELLAVDDELWETLLEEGDDGHSRFGYDDKDGGEDGLFGREKERVPVRRRRR